MTSKKTSRYLKMEATAQQGRPRQTIQWTTIEWYCDDLVRLIQPSVIPIKKIVAIARGGMVPASIIANALDIRDVHAIPISSYVEMAKAEFLSQPFAPHTISMWNKHDTLFVDDIVDSGDTYRFIQRHFPKTRFAALMVRSSSPVVSDFYAHIFQGNDWIVFPWEKES